MTLYTKCILEPKARLDGTRISVMSRHTLNDGQTQDQRITRDTYDEHLVVLAPPLRLIGDYYRRGLSWTIFKMEYMRHLQRHTLEVKQLTQRAVKGNVTILCIEESPEKCHRRLLAEECQRYNNFLEVIHL